MGNELITEEYRALNAELHQRNEHFGKRPSTLIEPLMQVCSQLKTSDVLDYGCGKGELNLHTPFGVKLYDPAIEKFSTPPEPADVVVCTDVLEHIEPQFVEGVLDELKRLTKKVALVTIACIPAHKTLADGRNAHISLHPIEWWEERIRQRFNVVESDIIATEGNPRGYGAYQLEPK
jgi:2-polyprenyl-3-methyl-5-hydroxy-6-metoxy-1,4-benzoquinol methylase